MQRKVFRRRKMKKIGKALQIMLLVLVTCAFIACVVKTDDAAPQNKANPSAPAGGTVIPPKNGKAYQFGYSVGEMIHPTNSFSIQIFEAKMKELGYPYTVTDAERRSDKQIDDINALIQKNIDALLILPTDGVAVAPGAEAAYNANIPVFTVLRSMPTVGDKVKSNCVADDFAIGKLAGIWISTALNGRGNVAYLSGTPGLSTSEERTRGFHAVMDTFPNIKIIAEQTAKYERAEAMTVMEGILRANPRIDALFAANDQMAGGAAQAIQAAGRQGIKIVGVNFQKDGYQRMLDGEQAADITTPMTTMTLDAIEAAIDYFNGRPVPLNKFTAVDIVTKENVKAFEDQLY
jgi:ribose transport system substrate-binding protein